jgi:hypothetical protein
MRTRDFKVDVFRARNRQQVSNLLPLSGKALIQLDAHQDMGARSVMNTGPLFAARFASLAVWLNSRLENMVMVMAHLDSLR